MPKPPHGQRFPRSGLRSRRALALAMVGAGALVLCVAARFDGAVLTSLEAARAQVGWAERERLGRLADYAELLGQGWLTVLIVLGIYLFDPRGRQRAVVVAFTLLAVMLATNLVKISTGRLRPKAIQKLDGDPAHVWLGPWGGMDDPKARAFPSGHTATAFAHAAVLSAIYPAAAPALFTLAAPVPVSRVLMRSHFMSDVIAGALLSLFLTRGLLRSARFRRLCERTTERLPTLPRHRTEAPPPAAVRAD